MFDYFDLFKNNCEVSKKVIMELENIISKNTYNILNPYFVEIKTFLATFDFTKELSNNDRYNIYNICSLIDLYTKSKKDEENICTSSTLRGSIKSTNKKYFIDLCSKAVLTFDECELKLTKEWKGNLIYSLDLGMRVLVAFPDGMTTFDGICPCLLFDVYTFKFDLELNYFILEYLCFQVEDNFINGFSENLKTHISVNSKGDIIFKGYSWIEVLGLFNENKFLLYRMSKQAGLNPNYDFFIGPDFESSKVLVNDVKSLYFAKSLDNYMFVPVSESIYKDCFTYYIYFYESSTGRLIREIHERLYGASLYSYDIFYKGFVIPVQKITPFSVNIYMC